MYLVGWPGGDWQTSLQWAGITVVTYVAVFWLALVFWTARDIWLRSDYLIVQAGAVLLVAAGFLPGHLLYLVVRPRTTRRQRRAWRLEEAAFSQVVAEGELCRDCGYPVLASYLVCPSCRLELRASCDACARPVEQAWTACPYCAAPLKPGEPAAANACELIVSVPSPDSTAASAPEERPSRRVRKPRPALGTTGEREAEPVGSSL